MFNLDTQLSLTVVIESSGYILRYSYVYKDGFLFTSNNDLITVCTFGKIAK